MNKTPKILLALAAGFIVLSAILLSVVAFSPAPEVRGKDTTAIDKKQAEQALNAFTKQVAPTKQTASTMVVPAEQKWWALATGFAPTLDLDPTALPENSRWIAFSQGRTQAKEPAEIPTFTALYVGFDTPEQAATYAPVCDCYKYVEGNVAMVVDLFSTFGQEAFPDYTNIDPAELKTSIGTWQINLTDWVRYTSDQTFYSKDQLAFFKALGIDTEADKDVIWSATATSPEGPWVGTLENYPLDKIDVIPIGKAIADSGTVSCTQGAACEETDKGLFDLIFFFYLNNGEYTFGDLEIQDPELYNTPFGDDIARGAVDLTYFGGAYTGLGYTRYSVLDKMWYRLEADKTLTVKFKFDE